MDSYSSQRKKDVNDNLNEDYQLLKKLEDCKRNENNPQEIRKLEQQIKTTRESIAQHTSELSTLAMISVTFDELEIVTKGIVNMDIIPDNDFRITPPKEKMDKNQLTREVQFLLRGGSIQVNMVKNFLQQYTGIQRDFSEKLKAEFINQYRIFCEQGYQGDNLFHELYQFSFSCHNQPSDVIKAAGLAVLYYFFETCDVFEK